MTELVALGLVLLAIAVIVAGMLRMLRRRGLRDAGPEASSGFVAGLVGAFAMASVLPADGAADASAAAGAVVAVAFGLLGILRLHGAREVLGAVLGVAGVIGSVIRLLTDDCGVAWPLRLGALGFVALPAALALAAAALTGRLRPRAGLALFGAVEVLAVLSSPWGLSLVGLGPEAWVLACACAGLFGAAAAFAPRAVCGFAAFVLTLASLAVGVLVGGPCDVGGATEGVVLPAAFVASHVVVRLLGRTVRR